MRKEEGGTVCQPGASPQSGLKDVEAELLFITVYPNKVYSAFVCRGFVYWDKSHEKHKKMQSNVQKNLPDGA